MPLTDKGEKILANYKKEYGEEKGERFFYASKNAGTIKGVDREYEEGAEVPVPRRNTEVSGNMPTEQGGYGKRDFEGEALLTPSTVSQQKPPEVHIHVADGMGRPVGPSIPSVNSANRAFWGADGKRGPK